MGDITKARFYLKRRGSKLQHLTTFGLMFATAEQAYREKKITALKGYGEDGSLAKQEIETAVDYAVLRHLKKYNQLPPNISDLFRQDITLEEKRDLATQWYNG